MKRVFISGVAVKDMTAVQKAWLACAIDGEGTIGIYPGGITKTGHKKWPITSVIITNTDRKFLEHARIITGLGSICTTKKRENRKVMYQWQVKGHQGVLKILLDIYPYLIIKRKKALGGIDFIKGRQWQKWTPEEKSAYSEKLKREWADPATREKRLVPLLKANQERWHPGGVR
jgi:hypothetical protein